MVDEDAMFSPFSEMEKLMSHLLSYANVIILLHLNTLAGHFYALYVSVW